VSLLFPRPPLSDRMISPTDRILPPGLRRMP
jgi:hypothetical protein